MRHGKLPGTIAIFAAALLLGAAGGSDPCAAQDAGGPDYGAFTATQLIPFAPDPHPAPLPFTNAVALRFRIGEHAVTGTTVTGTMDTGTTGVILAPHQIPGYRPEDAEGYPRGWEFLSSSKLLWVGHWIPQDLVFVDSRGTPLATARVPVLVVESEVRCVGYKEGPKGDGPNCPDDARVVVGPDTASFCRGLPPGSPCHYPIGPPHPELAYVGVGFGREYDGQPQGLPNRNPLLNITAIAGEPVQPQTMRSGYIITARGVLVGLTGANTAGFSLARLQPRMVPDSTARSGLAASTIPRDWGPATACIAVDGAQCASAAVLIDTGVDEMFLTLPAGMHARTDSVPDPSLNHRLVNGLAEGSRVDVSFPGTQTPAPDYSFRVGDRTNPTTPSVVVIPRDTVPFVNTGRHFLRAFEVLVDADGGWFGVRRVVPSGPPQASATGSFTPAGTRRDPWHALHVRRDEGL